MDELTEKQESVLKFIENYQFENGKSPTLKEIKEFLNVASDNSVLKHLAALQKKGFIQKDDTPRGIKLLDSVRLKLQATSINLPLMGYIPAGGPVAAEEHIESYVTVDSAKIPHPKESFMLRVTGQSMIDAGIFEGDMLIADSKKEPKVNDIVIGLIDNENTVKRLIKRDGKFMLMAENPDYEDLTPLNELEVQGVVIGLIRTY